MRRLAAVARVLAASLVLALPACYGAHAAPGSPCAPDNTCPSGQTCVSGVCELPGQTANDASTPTDGRATDAPADAPPVLGPDGWYPAKPVQGVNTSSVETDPSYTANRLTLVFASDRTTAGSYDLYIATRTAVNEPFTVTALTTVNSTNNENSPEIEPTGAYIYFSSDRSGSWKIYQSNQTSPGVWGAPSVVSSLTSSNSNLSLAVAPDNTEAMSVQQSSGKNKFEAYGRDMTGDSWTDEFEATEMEIANLANNPTLTDEGAVVYIDSGTPAQIYRSTSVNEGQSFSTPALVGDLNLGTRDAAPFISADDNHIIFERDGDLYEADRLTP